MNALIYPTLDLFAYDLKEALNISDSKEIIKNKEIFFNKLPDDIQLVDSDIETEYLELIIQHKIKEFKTDKIEGYYYPVRLNDTYGLQIDCSISNQTEPQLVNCFAFLKAEIERRLNGQSATLGQTWMLSGWLSEASAKNPEEIAKDCYKALFKEAEWQQDFQGQGTFCGGEIFELWQSGNTLRNIANYSKDINFIDNHVIITIYPNRESAEKAAEFYTDWMGLFCYRSKINWAYRQSRLIKDSLVNHYRKVEADRKLISNSHQRVSQNFSNFKTVLDKIQENINEYTIDLLELAFQKQVIDINLANYQTRLGIINQKLESKGNLEFLNKFSKLVNQKYLVQIAKDSENMQLGLRLLEDTINSVRSRIELEKAERDRQFQEFVAVVGGGIAGVSLVPADKNCEALLALFSKISFTFICRIPLFFNLIIFLIAAGLTWLIRRQWQRSR